MLWILLFLQTAAAAVPSVGAAPFAFFQPSVSVTVSEQSVLDRGSPIARLLPAKGHQEEGVFTAVPVNIDGNRLVAWERRIEDLKEGGYVLAIHRFSDPPRIEDLDGLELDKEDLSAIHSCHPGSCQIKLSAQEMARLRQASGTEAVQQAFREIILERVQLYISKQQIPPYEDGHAPVQPAAHFATLLQHSEFLSKNAPQLAEYLQGQSSAQAAHVESFFYWSKEKVAGKPIVSVTHVNIARFHGDGMPDTLIVAQDIFSSHYINASLSVTALVHGAAGQNYLAYFNRTEVDILHGLFAGVIRKEMHKRMKSDSTKVMETYRHRMEGGEPPQAPVSTP